MFGAWCLGFGFGVHGIRFRFQDLRLGVSGLGFGVCIQRI